MVLREWKWCSNNQWYVISKTGENEYYVVRKDSAKVALEEMNIMIERNCSARLDLVKWWLDQCIRDPNVKLNKDDIPADLQFLLGYQDQLPKLVCECGAEKCRLPHSNWCPLANTNMR